LSFYSILNIALSLFLERFLSWLIIKEFNVISHLKPKSDKGRGYITMMGSSYRPYNRRDYLKERRRHIDR
jgi:hypothetical protein